MNARRSRPRPHEPEALGPRGAGIVPPALLCGDNLDIMTRMPEGCCQLIYADPPFFTGKTHACAPRDGAGGQGRPERGASVSDRWPQGINSYLEFLRPRLDRMRHLLGPAGTLYVHLDWHAVHYVKVLLDELFGMDHFLGEIIWSYRTGGRSRNWLARKHDTILCYARKSGLQTFNLLREGTFRTDGMKYDEEGRPYKQTKGGRLYFHPDGPAMTDVWEIPFLSTVSLERTGYPTQKPEALLERIIQLSSSPGDVVGDFFCGSGTTLAAAQRLGRRWLGCDLSAEAVRLAARRLGTASSDGMPPGKSKDRGTRARGRTSGVECP